MRTGTGRVLDFLLGAGDRFVVMPGLPCESELVGVGVGVCVRVLVCACFLLLVLSPSLLREGDE